MNWGARIAILIVTFVVSMIGMVVVAFQQTNEMTDANYYQKELEYQQLIDAAHRLEGIEKGDILRIQKDQLVLSIPLSLISEFRDGKCQLLRWSDERMDKILDFTPSATGTFSMPIAQLSAGRYTSRISWFSNGQRYYKEQELIIPKL